MSRRWLGVPAGVVVLALAACGSSGSGDAGVSGAVPSDVVFEDGMTAKVVSVESANTFVADFEGVRKSVRLVNTAAPSENGVARSQTCLLDESKALLVEKLPEGTEVTLQFDENARGGTGYVEAAVFVGESFINWDMARAGMVATTFATAQDEFYVDVSNGQQDAANEGVGLYSKDVECSIPAAIEGQRAAVEDARGWEVADDDVARLAERERVFREASELFNELSVAQKAPSQWVGSIVTLDAVSGQLDDLKSVLGDDLYGVDGTSVNQQKKAEAEQGPVRPGQ